MMEEYPYNFEEAHVEKLGVESMFYSMHVVILSIEEHQVRFVVRGFS
jgi:hypothetical protein